MSDSNKLKTKNLNEINDFLKEKSFILYGVSKSKTKFGNSILKYFILNNYKIFLVHPDIKNIEGVKCYESIQSIPDKVNAAIISLNPVNTLKVLIDIEEAGIKKVWIQQKSESQEVYDFCKVNNISAIFGQCIFMFAEPMAVFHKFHRWINKLSGAYPQ